MEYIIVVPTKWEKTVIDFGFITATVEADTEAEALDKLQSALDDEGPGNWNKGDVHCTWESCDESEVVDDSGVEYVRGDITIEPME